VQHFWHALWLDRSAHSQTRPKSINFKSRFWYWIQISASINGALICFYLVLLVWIPMIGTHHLKQHPIQYKNCAWVARSLCCCSWSDCERTEMVLPMPTKSLLRTSPDAAILFAPFGCTHLPPPVPPFLLMQNLSPKDIARSDIMKLKVSWGIYSSMSPKELTKLVLQALKFDIFPSIILRNHYPYWWLEIASVSQYYWAPWDGYSCTSPPCDVRWKHLKEWYTHSVFKVELTNLLDGMVGIEPATLR